VAAPVESALEASTDKSFKLAITINHGKGETLYLTSTGTSADVSKAIDCKIESGKLACGSDKKGLTYGTMHTSTALKLVSPAPRNEGFSVDSSGIITWKTSAGEVVNFSTHGKTGTEVFAEVCNAKGHGDKEGGFGEFVPGVAKAVFA
jgi:hypothetical protein